MCVLTYIPDDKGHVVITHNRDEHFMRPKAIPPAIYAVGDTSAIFPKDPQSGGTWFAVQEDWVCCMLNGGFERHQSRPPYRVSRGSVILFFLQCLDIQKFTANFNALGMEPFTFVVFDLKHQLAFQLIWDEKVLHIQKLSGQEPHIWSSVTLYDRRVRNRRTHVFKRFLETKPSAKSVLDFHQLHTENHDMGFFVNIDNRIHTVAITQVEGKHLNMQWNYQDFSPKSTANSINSNNLTDY